jgi:hypothetical protein
MTCAPIAAGRKPTDVDPVGGIPAGRDGQDGPRRGPTPRRGVVAHRRVGTVSDGTHGVGRPGEGTESAVRGSRSGLPGTLFILVPHAGRLPLAMRRPLACATSAAKSRFSLHFTQDPLSVWASGSPFVAGPPRGGRSPSRRATRKPRRPGRAHRYRSTGPAPGSSSSRAARVPTPHPPALPAGPGSPGWSPMGCPPRCSARSCRWAGPWN